MKTLELNIVHRLLLVSMLNEEGKKGSTLSDLKLMLKIMEKIELKEEEKTEAEVTVDDSTNRVRWNPEKDITKEIELSDDEYSKIKATFKAKNDEKSFNFETLSPMLKLAEQLEVVV